MTCSTLPATTASSPAPCDKSVVVPEKRTAPVPSVEYRRCPIKGLHESQITNHQSLFTSHAFLSCRRRNFLLDGCAHQVAPLGPRAVVVADILVAEQILQHKPGVRTALADAAIGDDFLIARDALACVKLPERVGGLERAVLGHGLRPRNICRAGNVSAALRRFGHARRR